MNRLLLVEDDEAFSFGLKRALDRAGYTVDVADRAALGVTSARSRAYRGIILDLGLPDQSGHETLKALAAIDDTPIVVLTGRDDAASAVRALKDGAWDYLTKPVALEELLVVLARATLRTRVEAVARASGVSMGVGASPAWTRAIESLRAAAASSRTHVLISGESGTGKELCAKLVHEGSQRAAGPFVTINAGALPPSLLESELFGHEAGSFTGARGSRRGIFELADGGTLFLDEVGELPIELQPKLLRVLDGNPFRRLGGDREIRADVRIVSATNRSLEREVREQRFRLDLYHRLRVVEVHLPPLRERAGDVDLLVKHFLFELAPQLGAQTPSVTDRALSALRTYRWPGNVRELRNVLERALVLGRGRPIDIDDFPPEIAPARFSTIPPALGPARTLDEVVRAHVLDVFQREGSNLTRAAAVLGISRMTLRKKLRDYHAFNTRQTRSTS